jgi:hypothetical protein
MAKITNSSNRIALSKSMKILVMRVLKLIYYLSNIGDCKNHLFIFRSKLPAVLISNNEAVGSLLNTINLPSKFFRQEHTEDLNMELSYIATYTFLPTGVNIYHLNQ